VGQVVVDVEQAGVYGTDAEFFTGRMTYLHTGEASYPVRIGHEWCGVVAQAGDGVDPSWVGQRVTGDTMLGCGHCRRCRGGRQHVCAERFEIGIRNGWPGALAERHPPEAPGMIRPAATGAASRTAEVSCGCRRRPGAAPGAAGGVPRPWYRPRCRRLPPPAAPR
jgi:threonine dehydrogenase-like Zn-dependent dehydrogenase